MKVRKPAYLATRQEILDWIVLHETGHAVACMKLGRRIDRFWFGVVGRRWKGAVVHDARPPGRPFEYGPKMLRWLADEVTISMAGLAAEKLGLGKLNLAASKSDLEAALPAASVLVRSTKLHPVTRRPFLAELPRMPDFGPAMRGATAEQIGCIGAGYRLATRLLKRDPDLVWDTMAALHSCAKPAFLGSRRIAMTQEEFQEAIAKVQAERRKKAQKLQERLDSYAKAHKI